MAISEVDARTSLTKGQFLKIYRWQHQVSLKRLAALTALNPGDLQALESDEPASRGRRPNYERLTALLGCPGEIWDRVGVEPGFPGTGVDAATKTAPKTLITFVSHINRIAAMPDALRHRQMQVIQRELGYIDAFAEG